GDVDDVHGIDGLDRVPGADRLGEVVAGVDEQDVYARLHLRHQVDQRRVRHGRGEADAVAERGGGPPDYLQRGRALQRGGGRWDDVFEVEGGSVGLQEGLRGVSLPAVAGTPTPRNFKVKDRTQSGQYQEPRSSRGSRCSSPQ